MLSRYWIGGGLLVCCGFWCGSEVVRRWHCERISLEETTLLLQQILDAIQYRRLPTDEILRELQQCGHYSLLSLHTCQELQSLSPPVYLSKEEASQFSYCLASLGHQGLQDQCGQLQRYLDYFQKSTEQVREKERAAAAIFPKIGFCVGAMAALALL